MNQRTRIKICGITNLADRDLVARSGADYFGVVLEIDYSPRSLSRVQAGGLFLEVPIPAVALTCDRNYQDILGIVCTLQPYALQLQGLEPPELVASLKTRLSCHIWKALHLPASSSPAEKLGNEGEILSKLTNLAQDYAAAGVDAFIIDTMSIERDLVRRGGTGKTSNWEIAARLIASLTRPAFLAGGIRPGNVVEAVRQVKPFGVDLASGVEKSPGKKDPALVRKLVSAVRGAGSAEGN